MSTTEEYFSFVTMRIAKLQEEVKEVENEKQRYLKVNRRNDGRSIRDRKLQSYQLRIEFLYDKIKYLKKLEALPYYILVSKLSDSALEDIKLSMGICHCSKETIRSILITKLQLQQIQSLVEKNHILNQIQKLDFDFEKVTKLLVSHQKKMELENQSQALSSKIRIPEYFTLPKKNSISPKREVILSYIELCQLRDEVNIYEIKMEEAIRDIVTNYSFGLLTEINYYKNNPTLSLEFVLFHKEKVLSRFPELMPLIATFLKQQSKKKMLFTKMERLLKGIGLIKEIDMKPFLDGVIDYYYNGASLSFFGIGSENILGLSKRDCNRILDDVWDRNLDRLDDISNLKREIDSSCFFLFNKMKSYTNALELEKRKFMAVLDNVLVPTSEEFKNNLWEAKDLKQYLKKLYCNLELYNLSMQLLNCLERQDEKELLKERGFQLYKK